jgi:hypothetical protein
MTIQEFGYKHIK